MGVKKGKTALAILPPPELSAQLQRVRQRYDGRAAVWMPNVCVLHPFVARGLFDAAARSARLALAAARVRPFAVAVSSLRVVQRGTSFCVFAVPDDPSQIQAIRERVGLLFARCLRMVQRRPFEPHINLGQFSTPREAEAAIDAIRWRPIRWTVSALDLLALDARRNRYESLCRVPLAAPAAAPSAPAEPLRLAAPRFAAPAEAAQQQQSPAAAVDPRWANSFDALGAAPDADSVAAELACARHETAFAKKEAKWRRRFARVQQLRALQAAEKRARRRRRGAAPAVEVVPVVPRKGRHKMTRTERLRLKRSRTPYLRDYDATRQRAAIEKAAAAAERQRENAAQRRQIEVVRARQADPRAALRECLRRGYITGEQLRAFDRLEQREALEAERREHKEADRDRRKRQLDKRRAALRRCEGPEGAEGPAAVVRAKNRTIAEADAIKLDELKLEGFICEAEYAERTLKHLLAAQFPARRELLEDEFDVFLASRMGPLGEKLAAACADPAGACRGKRDMVLVGEQVPREVADHVHDQITGRKPPCPITKELLRLVAAEKDTVVPQELLLPESRRAAEALLRERPELVAEYRALMGAERHVRGVCEGWARSRQSAVPF
eukprot:m51a1_g5017 putative poly polymerase (613) ;mRNA; r:281869-284327